MPAISFGACRLDPSSRELWIAGQCVRLQEKPFLVLSLLLERGGDVVTRDELRQKLWPSSVYVDFDHGLNNAITRLRETLADDAAEPRFIETLPRLGYRFIHPITREPPATETRKPRIGTRAIATAAAVVIALGLLVSVWLPARRVDSARVTAGTPALPSIAVLPFVNMSSDPESEHFADGLSQELLNKLAGISGLRVAGRTSSFYFKDRQESLPAIAQALQVSHVLEGSVRRSGSDLRITAQLVGVDDGSPVWTQTFDRDLGDVFQVQEDIAIAVAGALQVELLEGEEQRLRRRGTRDAEAHRLYLIGNAQLTGIAVPRDAGRAKELFEQAIARDPHYAAAHARLAYYHFYRAWASFEDISDGVRQGMASAQRAVALDPESSEALQARANFEMWRYRFLGDYQAFVAANHDFRLAIQLDPYNDTAFFDYGRAILWHDPDLAQSLFERTVQIEPLRRRAGGMAALALGLRGQGDAARERLRKHGERALTPHASDAAVLASFEQHFGRLDQAILAARAARPRGGLEGPIQLWGLYMSLDDRGAAEAALDFGHSEPAAPLREAALLAMQGRFQEAFESLDVHRAAFAESRILDLPAARLALIAGRSAEALAIIEHRLPDVATGIEPINGHNVIPALDLVAARQATGAQEQSRLLLSRITAYLDHSASPRLPMYLYLRARAHALAGEPEPALRALDRAYDAGFRTTWASDLHPQPFFYMDSIDVDPAFKLLREHSRYQGWIARIRTDNARQRERLRQRDAAGPAA